MVFTLKKFVLLALSLMLLISSAGCGTISTNVQSQTKLKVAASIYPVYEFAKQVGGDKIEVTMLVPPGIEPHDWEPTAKEILLLKSVKLFFYHGAGFENLNKLLDQETLGNTKAIAVSNNISPLAADHTSGTTEHPDSHMWLDPVLAQQEVANIASALSEADPQNSDYYQKNAAAYTAELTKLDAEYQKTLATPLRRDIITSHASFGYLAKRYNLRQIAIMGLSPDSEPTPEKMANIVSFCHEHHVKFIFFETIVNPKLSETIAHETGAGLLVLNPIENLTAEDMNQGKNYLSVMRENLANLKTALNE